MNKCAFLHVELSDEIVYNKKLYDIYNVHKMIWELWESCPKTPFLFRLKDNNLYVLYNKPIDNTNVKWLENARITTEKKINFNGSYSYDIIVNPTKRDKKSKKIIPFKKESNIFRWWEQKGKQSGFEVKIENTIICNKHNNVSSKEIIIFQVYIQGFLKITNPDLFNEYFIKGFGRAKRFGCGLMLMNKKYS